MKKYFLSMLLCSNLVLATDSNLETVVKFAQQERDETLQHLQYMKTGGAHSEWLEGYYEGLADAYDDIIIYIIYEMEWGR